jgi:hypothetical protein
MERTRFDLEPVVRGATQTSAQTWVFYNCQFHKPIIQFYESENTYVESPFRLRFP